VVNIVSQIFDLRASELNNTVKAETDILVFNRVPKTGSIQMIELMKQLGSVHNYEVVVDPQNAGVRPILSADEEEDLIKNITQLEDRAVFASHVNYLDFKKYGKPRPIYVNLVRDPIERVISWHYYIRLPWVYVPRRRLKHIEMPSKQWVNTEFDQCLLSGDKACTYIEGSGLDGLVDHRRQTLFFCGHNERECTPFNKKLPMQIAMRMVEEEYAVVGTFEDTNVTLSVLESYIPSYFRGAKDMYYMGMHEYVKNSNPGKPHIGEDIKEMLRKNFTQEIEFYRFCRQRLHKQYLAIKLKELMIVDKELQELHSVQQQKVNKRKGLF
ncbi:heparan sulfate 2-O-sulfotransferase pipe-like, partial [Rhagoletis pomonella]|uniref:heparan sulfate 2-O-sulfotransferase pipe-like n=1 Tax=Rhagoletis pomonella TaxID=28610 RepID=UPI00177B5960